MKYTEPTDLKQPPEVFYETLATLMKKMLWHRCFPENAEAATRGVL